MKVLQVPNHYLTQGGGTDKYGCKGATPILVSPLVEVIFKRLTEHP